MSGPCKKMLGCGGRPEPAYQNKLSHSQDSNSLEYRSNGSLLKVQYLATVS